MRYNVFGSKNLKASKPLKLNEVSKHSRSLLIAMFILLPFLLLPIVGAQTIIFSDNFDDLNNWVDYGTSNPPSISNLNNQVYLSSPSSLNVSTGDIRVKDLLVYQNFYTYQLNFSLYGYLTGGSANFNMYLSNSDELWTDYFSLTIGDHVSGGNNYNFEFYVYASGGTSELTTFGNATFLYDAWNNLTVTYSQTSLNLVVNGDSVFVQSGSFYFDKLFDVVELNSQINSPSLVDDMSLNYIESTPTPTPTALPSSTSTQENIGITDGELSFSFLFVLAFMVVVCIISLVWFGRVPLVPLVVGLFTFLVGLYAGLGGVYSLGVVQGWFSLFVALFGGLTMLLVGLGVRVRR